MKAQFKVTGVKKSDGVTTVHITDRGYGRGTVELKWYIKASQATLVVNRKKGTSADCLKAMLLALKFLLEGIMNEDFKPDHIQSYKIKIAKTKCSVCQVVFSSSHGLSIHQSRAHKSQILAAQIAVKAKDDGLVEVSQDQDNSNGGQVKLVDYIGKKFPGAVIKRVTGDGACGPRAISLILFGTEDHWREISIAMNKMNREAFEKQEIAGSVSYPFHRIVSGVGKKEFFSRQEYLGFLETEESLFTWREGPDFQCISDILEAQLVILVSGDGVTLDGGKAVVIGEQHNEYLVLMLNKSSEHYFAVMNPEKHAYQQEIVKKFRAFTGTVSAECSKEVCSVKSHENLPAQLTDVMRRIEVLEQIVKHQSNELNELKSRAIIEKPARLSKSNSTDSLNMDTFQSQGHLDEIAQLNRLKVMKDQGFRRESPLVNSVEAPKVKPQPPVFCISCNLKFDSKEALKNHNNVCPKKQSSVETSPPAVEQLGSNIPVIPSSLSSRVFVSHSNGGRNYNCQDVKLVKDFYGTTYCISL